MCFLIKIPYSKKTYFHTFPKFSYNGNIKHFWNRYCVLNARAGGEDKPSKANVYRRDL